MASASERRALNANEAEKNKKTEPILITQRNWSNQIDQSIRQKIRDDLLKSQFGYKTPKNGIGQDQHQLICEIFENGTDKQTIDYLVNILKNNKIGVRHPQTGKEMIFNKYDDGKVPDYTPKLTAGALAAGDRPAHVDPLSDVATQGTLAHQVKDVKEGYSSDEIEKQAQEMMKQRAAKMAALNDPVVQSQQKAFDDAKDEEIARLKAQLTKKDNMIDAMAGALEEIRDKGTKPTESGESGQNTDDDFVSAMGSEADEPAQDAKPAGGGIFKAITGAVSGAVSGVKSLIKKGDAIIPVADPEAASNNVAKIETENPLTPEQQTPLDAILGTPKTLQEQEEHLRAEGKASKKQQHLGICKHVRTERYQINTAHILEQLKIKTRPQRVVTSIPKVNAQLFYDADPFH